jgi:putative ABC transport system permease protein
VIPPARVRWWDLWREAVDSVAARPVRSVLTMVGTILGTAAFIAIIGLTTTASGQITAAFNALEATEVIVSDQAAKTDGLYHFPASSGAILRRLNGVVDAGVFFKVPLDTEQERTSIATRPQVDLGSSPEGIGLSVYGAEPGTFVAAQATAQSGRLLDEWDIAAAWPVAVLGPGAAQRLGITTVATQPFLFVGDTAYLVVGIIADTGALPELGNAVILPASTALRDFGPPSRLAPASVLVRTDLGAASLIAIQAPLALSPDNPGALVSAAPPDWSTLTDPVNTSMNALLFGLAALALVIGCVAIANTSLAAVMERTGEIGLRRALGARAVHISGQFIAESAVLGSLGGLIGSALGTLAILLASAARGWTPFVNAWLLAAAPVAGALVGVLAGVYPAWRAARIQPAHALQHL